MRFESEEKCGNWDSLCSARLGFRAHAYSQPREDLRVPRMRGEEVMGLGDPFWKVHVLT